MAKKAKISASDLLATRPFTAKVLDDLDEERAKRLRQAFGQRLWLVSWSAEGKASWLARVSGPGHPETIERTGKTRVAAIEAAAEALREVIRAAPKAKLSPRRAI